MDLFSRTITTPLVLTKDDGVFKIVIKAVGGAVNILGNIGFKGMESQATPIAENDSFSMAAGPNSPIALTITPTASAGIFIFFN